MPVCVRITYTSNMAACYDYDVNYATASHVLDYLLLH